MLDRLRDYSAMLDTAPELLCTHDLAGRIRRVNRAFERLTGYSRTEAQRLNIFDLITPAHRPAAHEYVRAAIGGAPPSALQLEFVTKAGLILPLEFMAELTFTKGVPDGLLAIAHEARGNTQNPDPRGGAEQRLVETSEQLSGLARHLRVLHRLSAATYSSLGELFSNYLAAGSEIFGLTDGAILRVDNGALHTLMSCGRGPHAACVRKAIDPGRAGGALATKCCLVARLSVNDAVWGVLTLSSRGGEPRAPHLYAREILDLMAEGLGGAIRQRELTEALAHQARHDSLTRLPNRLLLSERLAAALDSARAAGSAVAVVFIDLDMFKQINDTLGHSAGDVVLQQVAARLTACMEEHDTLARMGGDEFTAILTGVAGHAEVTEYARRLLTAVRAPCRVGDYEIFVTASIGVSFYPTDGEDAVTLLRNADAAMYSAKLRGKNDVYFYNAETTATALERFELETHLRRALERHEFRVLYQPQVDLQGRLAGMEVLLAWEHPERGRIPPSQFIPIAEETGMILPIGAWVLRSASRVAAKWHRAHGAAIPVSINVSALQFAQANFVETIGSVLAGSGLDPHLLELEITESVVMRDAEQSTTILRDLRSLGVRIAIDDFGTGYSSLSYLRRLPADVLKIDRSFLHDLNNEGGAFALVNAIAVLAHTFGLQVIAEGVENQRQFELARKAGCDRLQGHLFGGALTADRMEERLRESVLPPPATPFF